jgi:hypothetical protein
LCTEQWKGGRLGDPKIKGELSDDVDRVEKEMRREEKDEEASNREIESARGE